MAGELEVHIWSDIACPWCYVGKRNFESALESFAGRDAVKLRWRSFELDPQAPLSHEPVDYAERLARKYHTPVETAVAMIDRMTEVGRVVGLDLRFDRVRAGNTFDAHRVLHLAAERGLQDALKERFLVAYFTEGVAIDDPSVLSGLAEEVGLDAAEVSSVLESDTYASAVRGDQAEAREVGITGVPFFVIGRYGVSGAQPPAVLQEVLEKAQGEQRAVPEVFAEGAACGPEGC